MFLPEKNVTPQKTQETESISNCLCNSWDKLYIQFSIYCDHFLNQFLHQKFKFFLYQCRLYLERTRERPCRRFELNKTIVLKFHFFFQGSKYCSNEKYCNIHELKLYSYKAFKNDINTSMSHLRLVQFYFFQRQDYVQLCRWKKNKKLFLIFNTSFLCVAKRFFVFWFLWYLGYTITFEQWSGFFCEWKSNNE